MSEELEQLLKSLGLDNYTSFQQSMERTVHWYLDNPEWLLS